MIDFTELYVANMSESLRQLTTYVGLSLSATVSAWVLDRPGGSLDRHVAVQPADGPAARPAVAHPQDSTIKIPSLAVPISRADAQILLMGLGLVFGGMALTAASGAIRASTALQGSHGVLAAACTFPSVASSSLGIRFIGAFTPGALICDIVRRHRREYSSDWIPIMLLIFGIGLFGVLTWALFRVKCPDI